jgi:hypothetical protein
VEEQVMSTHLLPRPRAGAFPHLSSPAWPAPPGRAEGLLYWPAVYAAAAVAVLLAGGMVLGLALTSPAPQHADEAPAPAIVDDSRVEPAVPVLARKQPAPPVERKPVVEERREAKRAPAPALPERPAPLKRERPETVRPPTSLLGTKVEFVDNPAAAARTAAREDKLLYVLHVSGNFEDPRFT